MERRRLGVDRRKRHAAADDRVEEIGRIAFREKQIPLLVGLQDGHPRQPPAVLGRERPEERGFGDGLFDFDLVAAIFGEMSPLSRIVYTLVGASALWQLFALVTVRDEQRARVAR